MIVDQSAELRYLIEPLKLEDPRLHQALERMIGQMSAVTLEVSPTVKPAVAPEPEPTKIGPPIAPKVVLTPTSVRLLWDFVPGAAQYEIRTMTQEQVDAKDWNTASFVIRTTSTVVDLLPFKGPIQHYAIKSMDAEGTYSDGYVLASVNVNMPKQVVVTGNVIDNNILLTWTKIGDWAPDEGYFPVDKYLIYRDGTQIGESRSSFVSAFESVAGVFIYSIRAVDIAGNLGTPASLKLEISAPPDYVLEDKKVSDLSGNKVNVVLYESNKLLGPTVVPSQTWEQHFASRTWQDPEDQVTAGYPYYIQPGAPEIGGIYGQIRGYYDEVFDYGEVMNNVVLTVLFNFRNIDPENPVLFNVLMGWSEDGVTWAYDYAATHFIEKVRHFFFRIELFGNDKSVAEIFNVSVAMSIRKELDGGSIFASAVDAGGTTVYFTKAFKDIESITVTPKSTIEPFTAIYDFQDVPNPTSFKVFVFDTTGMRISSIVDWKARGIIL